MKFLPIIFVAALVVGAFASPANARQLYQRPVKLDETGMPMHNSFERYERERKIRSRNQQHNMQKLNSNSGSAVASPGRPITNSNQPSAGIPNSGSVQNTADPIPTPSSTVINRPINRPVHLPGDPTNSDHQF